MKEHTEGKSPVEDDEKLSKEKKKVEKEGTFKKDWDWQGCRYWGGGGCGGVTHTQSKWFRDAPGDWCNVHLVFSLNFIFFIFRTATRSKNEGCV